MLSLLNLDQLAHRAYCEDNTLALAVLDKLDDEVSDAVEQTRQELEPNDADYSYAIWDAVNAVQWLQSAEWHKVEETRHTKDRITYRTDIHEDTSPYNNHIEIYKHKGGDMWSLRANAGQYGEQVEECKFNAPGFKAAQEKATTKLVEWIKDGLQLNVG